MVQIQLKYDVVIKEDVLLESIKCDYNKVMINYLQYPQLMRSLACFPCNLIHDRRSIRHIMMHGDEM